MVDPPPPNAVLFIGSSSFKRWINIQEYFPGLKVINQGFGGAFFPDLIEFADRIVLPYSPRTIVVYAGSRDLHNRGKSPPRY